MMTVVLQMVDLLWRLLCFRWLSYYDGNRTQTAMEMHIYYSFIANWVRYVLICVSFKANPTESRHCKPAFLTRVDTCSFPACFWHLCTFSMFAYLYTSSWGLILVISHLFISCVFLTLVYIQYVRIRLHLFLQEGVGVDTCTHVNLTVVHLLLD